MKRTFTWSVALVCISIAGATHSDAHERPLRSPLAVAAAKASTVASMLLEQYPEMMDPATKQKITAMMDT